MSRSSSADGATTSLWSLSPLDETSGGWELSSSRNPQQQSGVHAPCTGNHARPPLAIEEEISKGLAEVADRRAALERDLKALDTEQVRLRKLWNSSLPINRLPNELLVTIFMLYDTNCYEDPHGSRVRRSNLLRVCRYWYDVARACPALWRFVKVGRMFKYLQTCLELSATSPLDLVFINDLFPKKHLRLLRPHSHRIKELAITSMPDAWQPEVIDLLSRGMPALTTIKIHFPMPTFETNTAPDLCLLSSTPGHYPQLRSPSLTFTAAPQNTTIYTQLRSLSLTACSCGLTYEQFVDLISTCAHLEELRLSHFIDELGTPPSLQPPSLPPISLKHLRMLELLYSSHCSCSYFLSRFIVPSSARIHMRVWNVDHDTTSGLFPLFLPSQTSVHLPIIPNTTSVTLKGPFPVTTSLTATIDPQNVECGSMTLSNRIKSTNVPPNLLRINALAILTIFRGVSLTHLKFDIGHRYIADREIWEDLFTAFPALESLEMDPGWPLAESMWPVLAPNETSSGVVIPLPKLQHLNIKSLSCGEDPVAEDLFDDMVATLRARAALGVRLETLALNAIHPDNRLVKSFRRRLKSKYIKDLQSLVADVTDFLP